MLAKHSQISRGIKRKDDFDNKFLLIKYNVIRIVINILIKAYNLLYVKKILHIDNKNVKIL